VVAAPAGCEDRYSKPRLFSSRRTLSIEGLGGTSEVYCCRVRKVSCDGAVVANQRHRLSPMSRSSPSDDYERSVCARCHGERVAASVADNRTRHRGGAG
jgi:hypothetical protein